VSDSSSCNIVCRLSIPCLVHTMGAAVLLSEEAEKRCARSARGREHLLHREISDHRDYGSGCMAVPHEQ
jgi:hypothetical protein